MVSHKNTIFGVDLCPVQVEMQNLSRYLTKARFWSIMKLYECELRVVSHDPTKFGSYNGNEDIMVLVSHVMLQNHITEGSYNFIVGSCSREVTILSSVLAIGTVVVEMCFKFFT